MTGRCNAVGVVMCFLRMLKLGLSTTFRRMNFFKIPLQTVGALVLLSALVTLALTAFFYQRSKSFLRDAIRADGKVVRLVERPSSGSGTTLFFPVYTFRDARGQEREIYSDSGSFPPSQSVGDTVTLLYRPQQPNAAKTDDFLSLWGLPALLGGFGVLELLVGGALFVAPVIISRFRHEAAQRKKVLPPPR
jgi:hypothetical protein